MQANKKTTVRRIWLVCVFTGLLASVSGWFLAGKPTDWLRIQRPDPVGQALELIRTRYVDDVSIDSLKDRSLDSLASALDPHSAYLAPNMVRMASEQLAGQFAGIGIEFGSIQDTITVLRVMPGSPSEQAGLMIGDQLMAIEGRSLIDSTITLDSILVLVRGEAGRVANLTIRQLGVVRQVNLKRTNIPTPSVTAQYMLNDTTGFIKLTRFATGSYRETVLAIEKLQKMGMRALVLDLRGNGGGFMQEAVELADEFLADDRLIVYTEGAHLKRRSYSCKRPGLFELGNLIVLMNESSASASEVLAGALQDWCRATIVGRRSYGKGLVQEQYELSNGGALRLTVARYYTPIGRCIQRPYSNDRIDHRSDSLYHQSDPKPLNLGQPVYLNSCDDTLYAGGGIWPDQYVDRSTTRVNADVDKIKNNSDIVIWSYRYYQAHKHSIDPIADMTRVYDQLPAASIRSFLTSTIREAGFKPEAFSSDDWQVVSFEVFAQIARFRFGPGEYTRFLNTNDPYIRTTRSLL